MQLFTATFKYCARCRSVI